MLCVDEKDPGPSMHRADAADEARADRTAYPRLQRGNGTTTLFAALEIATGQVTAAVKPRHRHQEFLSFLRQIDRAYGDQELHCTW